jgi:radical SAM-linked protein
MRCFERLFRRARFPLAMSQGFHPRPRMSFPSPLALGIEGLDEVMEVELTEVHFGEELLDRLNGSTVPDLTVKSVELLPKGSGKAQAINVSYEMGVPQQCRRGLIANIERLLASSTCPVWRPDRATPVDLRPLLEELSFQQGVLSMQLRTGSDRGARPDEVLLALGLRDLEHQGVTLRRTSVELQ